MSGTSRRGPLFRTSRTYSVSSRPRLSRADARPSPKGGADAGGSGACNGPSRFSVVTPNVRPRDSIKDILEEGEEIREEYDVSATLDVGFLAGGHVAHYEMARLPPFLEMRRNRRSSDVEIFLLVLLRRTSGRLATEEFRLRRPRPPSLID